MAYKISISEEQRRIILKALQATYPNPQAASAGEEADEAAVMAIMFRDLQGDEVKHPGSLHGFCL